MAKIIVGMSGGIDSSVTAHLLKTMGYDVEGVSFLMWERPEASAPACCSLRALEETSRTARQIGIYHDVIDVRDDFSQKVIVPFVEAYRSGLTPNPCILCNRHIKFPYLIKEADKKGAEYIATGHYARVEKRDSMIRGDRDSSTATEISPEPLARLKKGVDARKDQSYVLYVLGQGTLKRLILPLGGYAKNAVREAAGKLGLAAAKRSESQEICFIQEKNYVTFIQNFFPAEMQPGPIIDVHGKNIGTHKGIYGYTIGQRKGLGVASREPLYVLDIDIQNNTVYAGPRDSAKKREFYVHDLNWIVPPSLLPTQWDDEGSGTQPGHFRATVKIRSTMKDVLATIFPDPGTMTQDAREKSNEFASCNVHHKIGRVVFDEPQWAPAPGQSAVFYNGDAVIGGGIIKKSG